MEKATHYKLILADDHTLLRDALSNLINNFEDFSVIANAGNGEDVLTEIRNGCRPDIILMDLNMPLLDGYETSRWLQEHYPNIKVVILTMYDSEIALIRLLQVGVYGFLKKDIHPNELKHALLTIASGEYYYSSNATGKIASLFRKTPNKTNSLEKALLNDTEIEFLKLASTDMTYKEIAQTMKLTPRHIDTLRDNLFDKLDVKSRVGLAIYAVKNGIVTI